MAESAKQKTEKGLVKIIVKIAPLLLVADTAAAVDAPGTGTFSILSVPAAFGEPRKADADVAFVSDGFVLGGCKVIRSSGDVVADAQACKTLTYRAAVKPVKGTAPVWITPPINGVYVTAKTLNSKSPVTTDDFPSESLRRGENGTVVLRVDIDAGSTITRCEVVGSSGYSRLDDAARRAMCRRLKPISATLDGQPVASINLTRVTFYSGKF